MPRTSAGLLPFTTAKGVTRVFLGRMGGPAWGRRPRAWTVVKGEYGDGDDPLAAAEREFLEEIGIAAPPGPRLDLGEVRQSGGKRVRAWAVEADPSLAFVSSNLVTMEWPPRSGRRVSFPEIERAEWCEVDRARELVVAAQTAFLDRLVDAVAR
ncbi:NUDIX domain-containing protein [Janibacter cremeus]|uniref:NUDIX domain-containing protein n=1 Tax=Janibacter cremeus TaxID=1285192 RepID=UPI0023F713F6|nr:NUDIX domain-containing protein [Janibacter cremeus]WEV79280.1 NUDIX domain-containing protein [Janibacter cremeus]